MNSRKWAPYLVLGVLLLALVGSAKAQSPAIAPNPQTALETAFSYQGQLRSNGRLLDETCDMTFSLYASETGEPLEGSTITKTVAVSMGLFGVDLDFGSNAFDGDERWLGITVRCPDDEDDVDLGRQRLTATPYALYALQAPWGGLSDVPDGLADGDDDTTYTAGDGLSLDGSTLNVVTSTIQHRVGGVCASGSSIRTVGVDGSVTCETDDDTTYSAGTGLEMHGSTISVTLSYQLPQACDTGQVADWDGSAWVCSEPDPWTVSPSDGCSAIQQAIDALPASGGRVVVAAGTYTCSTAIVIDRDHVDLRGEGPATLLRLADGANSPVLVLGGLATPPAAGRRDIRVSDLIIDGNRLNQPDECWGGECGTGGLTDIRNNGITLRRVSDVTIERVTVYSARSGGLVSEMATRRLTLRGFTAYDNHFDGVAGYETEDSVFSDLYLYDNLAAGFSFDIRFDHNIISNAVISDTGSVGIFMRDSRDNLFESLLIRNSGDHGVFMAQVDGNTATPASGNSFVGLVVSGSAGDGFRVNNTSCTDNLVTGAQFANNAGDCIYEPAPGLVVTGTLICR